MGGGVLKTVALALCLLASVAGAAEVSGSVRMERPLKPGEPRSFAPRSLVVYLTGFSQPPPRETERIAQRNKTFLPALRVIVAGQSVEFTNDDVVLHNVFSTSEARPFDLGKPGPGQTRAVKFPTPGLVDVYCNIHEQMAASVLVLPNRAFAFVDAEGKFTLTGVPPGRHVLHAYGPEVEPFSLPLEVTASANPAPVELSLRARTFKAGHLDKYGRPYRARGGYEP